MPLAALIPALLPLLWAGLRVFVLANLVGFVTRLLAAFGLYFFITGPVTELGMEGLQGALDGLPLQAANWIGFLNFDRYLSITTSAIAIVTAGRVLLRHRGQ